jgi:hypothetical protein
LKVGRVEEIVPVVQTGKVGVPVNVVGARLVASVVTVERTERTPATLLVDTIVKVGRVKG